VSEDHDFIFREPNQLLKEKEKSKAGRPWPPPDVIHEDDQTDHAWRKDGVYGQVEKTQKLISEAKVRDEELAYYVLETVTSTYHPDSVAVLKKLNARVLVHIDPTKNKVLVEAQLGRLREVADSEHTKTFENNVHLLRPLRIDEKISEDIRDSEWARANDRIIIELVPNIDKEKREEYLEKTTKYLQELGLAKIESTADRYLKASGLMISKASLSQSKEIANDNNLIYRISRAPPIKKSSKKIERESQGLNSMDANQSRIKYIVCVADTGLNDIRQLNGLIEARSNEDLFADATDEDDHGTPVSCLVTYGEGRSGLNPSFRIASHKLFSQRLRRGDLFSGLTNAIALYKDKTRVFISSCIYEYDTADEKHLTALLDRFVQEQDVCVVFCSGNISPPYDPSRYPGYILSNKVQHPSDALSMTSVGSLVKRTDSRTFAPVDGPSPFTRVGCNASLKQSPKPEVVQHGGNCSAQGDRNGLGVETFSHTGSSFEDCGTSFSSPLFARILASIYIHYGTRIRNSETARAIAYSSCHMSSASYSGYLGLGEPDLDESIRAHWNNAKIVFGGNIPLECQKDGEKYDAHDEIGFVVPSAVSEVNLTIVRTDNYSRYLVEPRINTWLSVKAWKPGCETPVSPREITPGLHSHVRRLQWRYSRGTVGRWKFEIHPRNITIPKNEKGEVSIRYGAVVELKARRGKIESLTKRFRAANNMPAGPA